MKEAALILLLLILLDCEAVKNARIPVVIETDIGQYMDDAWALTLALSDPQLDVKLVITATNDTISRAKLVAKLLTAAGHSEIPIAISQKTSNYCGPECYWSEDFDLSKYKGGISFSPQEALFNLLSNSSSPFLFFELAPPIELGSFAFNHPELIRKTVTLLSTMAGSIDYGYGHKQGKVLEYNAKFNVSATQMLFTCDSIGDISCWNNHILSPLDTSGILRIEGDDYKRLLSFVSRTKTPLLFALIESYHYWAKFCPLDPLGIYCAEGDPEINSAILFDVQAVAMGCQSGQFEKFLSLPTLKISVDNQGFTNVDNQFGKSVIVATNWKDKQSFIQLLVDTYIGNATFN